MFHEQVSSDDVSHWMTSACLHVRLISLELVCMEHNFVGRVVSMIAMLVLCVSFSFCTMFYRFFRPDVFVQTHLRLLLFATAINELALLSNNL